MIAVLPAWTLLTGATRKWRQIFRIKQVYMEKGLLSHEMVYTYVWQSVLMSPQQSPVAESFSGHVRYCRQFRIRTPIYGRQVQSHFPEIDHPIPRKEDGQELARELWSYPSSPRQD